MGRSFVPALALVQKDHVLVVDGQTTVRVDGHAEQSRVCLSNASQSRLFQRQEIARIALSSFGLS